MLKKIKNAVFAFIFSTLFLLASCGEIKTNILNENEKNKLGTVAFDGGSLPNIEGLYTVNIERNILWGFTNMYHPTVIKVKDKKYPYRLYFFGWATADMNLGWPGLDAIFIGRGKNLSTWEIYSKSKETGKFYWNVPDNSNKYKVKEWAPVIYPSKEWFDDIHNGDPSIAYKDGMYYMAYSAQGSDLDGYYNSTSDMDGIIEVIMGATSRNGINWTKSAYPILIWEHEIGKLEYWNGGTEWGPDNPYMGNYCRPSIMYDNNKWRMWFDYYDEIGVGTSMGYAENTGDFMKFSDWKIINADKNPQLRGAGNVSVIKIKDKYVMYGDTFMSFLGVDHPRIPETGWANHQLFEAVSDDGLDWEITGYIVPDEDSWANMVCSLYYEQGHLFLLYSCQEGYGDPRDGITGGYSAHFDRLRYMVRSVDYQYEKGVNFFGKYT